MMSLGGQGASTSQEKKERMKEIKKKEKGKKGDRVTLFEYSRGFCHIISLKLQQLKGGEPLAWTPTFLAP